MSADFQPPVSSSTASNQEPPSELSKNWVNLFLQPLVRGALTFPRFTLAMALLLMVSGLVYSAVSLQFKTSRLDLINPRSEFNQLWLDYIKSFGSQDDVVVIVEGASEPEILRGVNALADSIRQEESCFSNLFYKVETSQMKAKGLHFTTEGRLNDLEAFVDEVSALGTGENQDILNRLWNCWRVQLAPSQSVPQELQKRSLEGFDRLSASLECALGQQYTYLSPLHGLGEGLNLSSMTDAPKEEYLWAKKGTMALILLKFRNSDNSALAQNDVPLRKLRDLIQNEKKQYPALTYGLTGLPVMENDEMSSSQNAMNWATFLSIAAVGALFLFSFKGFRYSLLLMATLIIGIGWTMGAITLTIGHLNILSIAFSAILVGLGVDFGVHYLARYLYCRRNGTDIRAALLRASKEVGPGIFVGALTTCVAFAAAGGQEFIGVAELGMIAAGGVMICCIAALLILPVMLLLADQSRQSVCSSVNMNDKTEFRLHMCSVTDRFSRNFAPTVVLMVGVSLAACMFLPDLTYDHNLMNLQPKGQPSVEWEKRLLKESDRNVWFALSMSKDPKEILARKEAFLKQPNITHVEELVSWMPDSSPEKQKKIAHIHEVSGYLMANMTRIRQMANGAIGPLSTPPTAGDLNAFVTAIENCPSMLKRHPRFKERIDRIRLALTELPPQEISRRLKEFESQMCMQYAELVQLIHSVSNPEDPTLNDLPQGLVDRLCAKDGTFAMRIYGKGDLWSMDNLTEFVRQVREVDPNATGNPLQTYECSLQMKKSYETAAWFALAGILFILYLDFRSLRHTFLAMIPLALGVLFLFGMMGFLQVPLNSANMIVLPLILGIGIDDGVHIVHDYRRRNRAKPFRISNSTAGALTLTSLTSILGFGSLLIAEHRGLQSLGMTLTMGVASCMFTSLSFLPSILTRWSIHELVKNKSEQTNRGNEAATASMAGTAGSTGAASMAQAAAQTIARPTSGQIPAARAQGSADASGNATVSGKKENAWERLRASGTKESQPKGKSDNNFIPMPGNQPIPVWQLEEYLNKTHSDAA